MDDLSADSERMPLEHGAGDGGIGPPFRPPYSRGQRLWRVLTVSAAIILGLLVVFGGVAGLRAGVDIVLGIPTPGPLPPGSDLITIQAGMPWGMLTVDGRAVTPQVTAQSTPMRLDRGTHHLVWTVAPFPPLRCSVSVPAAAHDTCPTIAIGRGRIAIREVVLAETLDRLPAGPRADLVRAIQTALAARTSTTTVRPGELYRTGLDVVAATAPLAAALRFDLVIGEDHVISCYLVGGLPCGLNGQDCLEICTLPPAGGAPEWLVMVPTMALWDITDGRGRVVVADQPDGSPFTSPAVAGAERLVPLTLEWDRAGWRASAQLGTGLDAAPVFPVCVDALAWLAFHDPFYQTRVDNPTVARFEFHFAVGAVPADGCLAVVIDHNPAVTPPPPALYLDRFGVFLAASATANSLLPGLPLADAAERAYAQEVAATVVG